MPGHTSGVSFSQYDNDDISYQYVCQSANSFRATDTQHVDLSALDFYLWRH